MKQYYVGLTGINTKREVFFDFRTPTVAQYGKRYGAVIGPFRTKRGAVFMAEYGANNPHCYTVDDAERIAKELANVSTNRDT